MSSFRNAVPSMQNIIPTVDPVVQWISYSPLDPRFTGSNPAGVDGFFRA